MDPPRSRHRTLAPSATVVAKALRILAAGHVEVVERTPGRDVLEVVGEHDVYLVVREGEQVRCPCPATRPCSHALAAMIAAGRRWP